MFIENKYLSIYNNIISRAKSRVLPENIYTEKHHVVPKSLGGSNLPENLVRLLPREHFICHRLLVKVTTGKLKVKMVHAAWCLANLKRPDQERVKATSRTYELLKAQWLNLRKGKPGPNLGRKMPEGFGEKQSKLKKGIPIGPMSEETKRKLSKPKTEEHKRKLSESRAGRSWGFKHSDETKTKMSDWQKGVAKPKVICEHCSKETSQMNYARWHGNNCKSYAKIF